MARNTRQDRRARREKQGDTENSVTSRARARQQQVRPASQPTKSQGGSRRSKGNGGSRRFIAESWGELRKVDWPGRSQVIQGTVVVLIACAIVGAYLFVNDLVWKRVVQNVLLGQ